VADDIVNRLQDHPHTLVDRCECVRCEAAAEVERLRAEVERLTQLHERIAASDDVAKAYQQVYFEDFPTVKQAVAETLLAKEQLAAERAEIQRQQVEIERLRAALAGRDALCDQLALALTTAAANEVEFDDDCWATINAALAAYDKHKEARRG
jgi:hypothetical protein